MKENKCMREIHEIQEKIYEETKNMTMEERIKYFNSSVDEMEKEYGIKFKRAKVKASVK